MVPEAPGGGIHSYSKTLWDSVSRNFNSTAPFALNEPWFLKEGQDFEAFEEHLSGNPSEFVHIQHEYGLFGGKSPGKYRFPRWISRMKRAFPSVQWMATAHTVIGPEYRYPYDGTGVQKPLRWAANQLLLPSLQKLWNRSTWGPLALVWVHSSLQQKVLQEGAHSKIAVLPHYVPQAEQIDLKSKEAAQAERTVLVFGFFSVDKGQDLLLKALRHLPPSVKAVLAGGVRRRQDEAYYQSCVQLIQEHRLQDRVKITGFVPDEQIQAYYEAADFIVAPFRATSGSGSLAQGLARGALILASDLPLNREIAERVPQSLRFFRSADENDLAQQMKHLLFELKDEEKKAWSRAAALYANRYSLGKTAQSLLRQYETLLDLT